QPAFMEQLDVFVPHALDIEGIARDEVAKALGHLGGADQPAGGAAHRLAFLAHRIAAADRADLGEYILLRTLRAFLRHDADNLGDHIAGALDHHRVADADVFAADFVLV